MKVLLDTNIILDIALNREPFVRDALLLLKISYEQEVQFYLTATTITDLYYIIRKQKGKGSALAFLTDLLAFIDVVSVDKEIVIHALNSNMPDFEDAVQVYSAKQDNISTIITRNEDDFSESGLTVYTPASFIKILKT